MGGKISKKIGKIILRVITGLLILDILVTGLLFVPAVQNLVVNKITRSLSEQWGTGFSIREVRLTPSLKTVVKGIRIEDHRHGDMIYVGNAKVRIKAIALNPIKLKFRAVDIDSADIVLRKYAGDTAVNISIWAQKFKKKQTQNPFLLSAGKLNLTHSRFVYVNDQKRTVWETQSNPDIDYAYFELKDLQAETEKFLIQGSDISTVFKHLAFKQYGGFALADGSGDFRICDTTLTFNRMKLNTQSGKIDADLQFKYAQWASYRHFNDSVRIIATIRPSALSLQDIAGFAPKLKGMNEVLFIKADNFDGYVNQFHLVNLYGGWGMRNYLKGNLSVRNITDFKHAYISLQLDSCNVNIPELAHFNLPDGKKIVLNKMLSKFGNTSLNGYFTGSLSDFKTRLDAYSDAGVLFVNLSTRPVENQLQIIGSFASPNLNMAKLTGQTEVLGYSDLDFSMKGKMDASALTADNFRTFKASLIGQIHRFDLYHYPVSQIDVQGDYQNGQYNCSVKVNDPLMACDFTGELAVNEPLPRIESFISLHRFELGAMASLMPAVDSTHAKGMEKLISYAQRNPSLQLGFDGFSVDLKGNRLDNVNGALGCDNIHFSNNNDSINDVRVRLTAINAGALHKFILASSIANASLETTYPLSGIVDSLKAIAYNFFPNLLPAQTPKKPTSHHPATSSSDYLKIYVNTYRTLQILHVFMPDLLLAPHLTIDLAMHSDTTPNTLKFYIPGCSYKRKLKAYRLSANASSPDKNALQLSVHADSVTALVNNNRFAFRDINIGTRTQQNIISYNIFWHNDIEVDSEHKSILSGIIDASNSEDILFKLRNSVLYVRNVAWQFNDDNSVHVRKNAFDFDNLLVSNGISEIIINGTYNKHNPGKLSLNLRHVDISMVNPFLSNMSFGGNLSAMVALETQRDRNVLTGKMLVSDFSFNNELIGNLFLTAGRVPSGFIGFGGGIFRRNEPLNSDIITNYRYPNFKTEHIIAKISGDFLSDKKRLTVHTDFDTLNAGFLTPFLKGFSNYIRGTASGELSFYAMPDTTYFDGDVHVLQADMGISALGTHYLVQNQHIIFNREGIFFDNMRLEDPDHNIAFLDGSVKHRSFKNMKIDLTINTDRVMVLNAPKTTNSVFYGTGYVAGKVNITGYGKKLYFKGPNIQALDGSKIVLQVSGSNLASRSDVIHFKAKDNTVSGDSMAGLYLNTLDKTALDFDFTFNIDNSTEVVLLLNPIGGTLNGRTDGKMQLTYGTDGLNLYGNLQLHSGDFNISLYNVVNQRFTLVPGGNILFDGPIENMLVNVSAYKRSKTSIANIIPQEYLTGNSANVNVNAYLKLDGPLMQRIDPVFSFELPNSSNEICNLFYTAIDTSNKENITKQFAYFLLTDNFMPNDMFSGSTTNAGVSGYGMLSNIVNSMLNNLISIQHGSFGLTYNQATETSSAEYGVKANANLLKRRMSIETGIGYYDDRTTPGNGVRSNMYGDFTVEYILNKSGTLKAKVYTYLGERDEDYYLHDSQVNYTAGAALVYKQEFNTLRRKRQKQSIKKNTKSHHEKQ